MNNIINKDIQIPFYSLKSGLDKPVVGDPEIFGIEPHTASVQLAVKVDLANRRQATAKVKTRAEVSGGGKKPWRQKGTGRARAGSSRSPLWRHGGIVFGPTGTQNYTLKMNKRVHTLALISALSDKAAKGDIMIVNDIKESKRFEKPSTKAGVKALADLGVTGKKVIFVLDGYHENFILSLRNIEKVFITSVDNLSVYDILNADKVIYEELAYINAGLDDINQEVI